jgi:hypothetical protein
MSEIHECLTVLCPFDQTPKAAQAYVASLPEEDGKHLIPIRISVGDLTVERRADLKINHSRAYPGFEIMEIAWKPHDGGPYPVFRGTLSVEDVGGNFSRLDLDGAYDPPGGIAGAAFDAVVGHRIAVAGARQLLEEIKHGMELAFQTGATV